MKTALKFKFLLYLSEPNHNQGFTKLGLLFRLLIYGTAVTALSFPFYAVYDKSCPQRYSYIHFWGILVKGCQAEGKQYVAAVNKTQQAYYTENGQFVTSSDDAAWASLGVGIKTQTANYTYRIQSQYPTNGPFQKKDGQMIIPDRPKQGNNYVMVIAQPLSSALNSYVGIVRLVEKSGQDKTTESIICESERSRAVQYIVVPPRYPALDIQCPEGFRQIK